MRSALEWLSLCRLGRRYLPLYSAAMAAGALFLPRPLGAAAALALSAPWLALEAERVWPVEQVTPLRSASAQAMASLGQVEVDERLLHAAPEVSAAYLPFDPAPGTPLQKRPGALLLASAATVTLPMLDGQARSAVTGALKAMGFTREQFLSRCPLRGEVRCGELTGLVTRDGLGLRAYFLDDPSRLLPACRRILDGTERDVTGFDLRRLQTRYPDERLYAYATAPVTEEGMGPLTYLGALTVASLPNEPALQAMKRLRDAGLTAEPCDPCAPLQEGVLRVAPDSGTGLRLTARPEEDFAAPVLAAIEAARRMESRLHLAALALTACFFLTAWLPCGAWLLAAAPALWPALALAPARRAMPRHPLLALSLSALLSFALWHFLCYAAGPAAAACMPMALCGAAAWLGPWLCGTFRTRGLSLGLATAGAALVCLMLSPPALPAAFSLLAGIALALAFSAALSPRRASQGKI